MNPRAASATRALLRLTPCHRIYRDTRLADASGTPGSLELTGECDSLHFTFPRSERISRTTRALGMHLRFQFSYLMKPFLVVVGFC